MGYLRYYSERTPKLPHGGNEKEVNDPSFIVMRFLTDNGSLPSPWEGPGPVFRPAGGLEAVTARRRCI
jgi:hypothetical protein